MTTGAPTQNMPKGPPLPPLRHWVGCESWAIFGSVFER